jgi:cytochrome c peroxidase
MRTSIVSVALPALVLAVTLSGCSPRETPPPQTQQPKPSIESNDLKSFAPLPEAVPAAEGLPSEDMVTLGRMLFFEPRLSKSQKISCNSCHNLATYGVDNQPTSDGHKGQKGTRNSPTVYNAAAHFAQFWDGRAPDVEAQAKGPVLNPVEMAMPTEPGVVKVLGSMPEYVQAFKRAFPKDARPVNYDNMARAIGAFERRLMTPSRWDALLRGDPSALTPAEQVGFKTFMAAGCQSCHAGALLGGTFYQKLGVVKPFPRTADRGREMVTKNAGDQGVFKVPSLRNVEKTGPYFHDGGTASLEQAVHEMAEYQLGQTLTDEQTRQIVDFLKVLTGKIDPAYIAPPVLPKSTPATPKPDDGN